MLKLSNDVLYVLDWRKFSLLAGDSVEYVRLQQRQRASVIMLEDIHLHAVHELH